MNTMNKGTISVLIADDHRIMREGLRALLEKDSAMKPVAEADTGRKTVKLVRELKPDVVVMDVTMPDLNGIEATRQIKEYLPAIKVVGLSMHADKQFVMEMFKAGASGYLLKQGAFEELGEAIRCVVANKMYVSPNIATTVVSDFVSNGKTNGNSYNSQLTSREREVLQLLAEGRSTKQIASCLHLSVKTVETHRKNIMEKLKLHSVAELTKYAVLEGITPLEN